MIKALVTGSGGLIGSECVRFFSNKGFQVLGIDNNMREHFFGERGDTSGNIDSIMQDHPNFGNWGIDIRDRPNLEKLFIDEGPFKLIIHTAAQPSHDWAAKNPFTDFDINAGGTLNMLEFTRRHSPGATFIFTSTNKVYGDAPNDIPLKEEGTRWEYDLEANFNRPELRIGVSKEGINEQMTLDRSIHSVFGASKAAADLMAQEYGINFGLNVGVFRGGCLTGPQHSAVALHGYLKYIVECAKEGREYTIFGYKGKQVRDQIHSWDVANAFWHFHQDPKKGEVYNLGGGSENAISILETKRILDTKGLTLNTKYSPDNRRGDHVCYYSDMHKFREDYPEWEITKGLPNIFDEMIKT